MPSPPHQKSKKMILYPNNQHTESSYFGAYFSWLLVLTRVTASFKPKDVEADRIYSLSDPLQEDLTLFKSKPKWMSMR